jgi:hypothetical protein
MSAGFYSGAFYSGAFYADSGVVPVVIPITGNSASASVGSVSPTILKNDSVQNTHYAYWNPLDKAAGVTLSQNNLAAQSATPLSVRANVGISWGTAYWEIKVNAAGGPVVGIMNASASLNFDVGADVNGWGLYLSTGQLYHDGVLTTYSTAFGAGSILGISLDMATGTLRFWRNGVDLGVAFTGLTGKLFPATTGFPVGTDSLAVFDPSLLTYAPSGYTLGVYTTSGGTLPSIAASVGTQSPTISVPISGNLALGAVGTVAASVVTDVTVAAIGNLALGSVGTTTAAQTKSLTGNLALGSVGNATASQTITKSLTGNLALGSVGTTTASQTKSLTGNLALGSVGTMVASQSSIAALTGNAATGSVGTTTASIADTNAITGNLALGEVGSLTASQILALTGNAATGSVGSLTASQILALTGNAATGSVGSLTTSQAVVSALTGNAATGSVGTTTASIADTNAITGNLALGEVGTTTALIETAIAGNAATGSVDTLSVSQSFTLTGNAATSSVDTLTAAQSFTLIGNAASATVDNTQPAFNIGSNLYATWDPSVLYQAPGMSLSNGNLTVTSNAWYQSVRSTQGISTGRIFWEVVPNSNKVGIGITGASHWLANWVGNDAVSWAWYSTYAGLWHNGSRVQYWNPDYVAGDVVGVGLDMTTGELHYWRNGVYRGIAFSGITGTMFPAVSADVGASLTVNFGATPLQYPQAGWPAGTYIPGGLPGNTATGSVGTAIASQTNTKSLTGNAAIGSVETLTVSQSLTLTGNAAAGTIDDISANEQDIISLTGVTAAGDVGSVTKSITINIQGNDGFGDVGDVGVTSGTTVVPVTGVVAHGYTGVLAASQAVTATITGNAGQGAVDSVYSVHQPLLSGVSLSGTVGTMFPIEVETTAITGVDAVGDVGSVHHILSIALSDVSGTGSVGNIASVLSSSLLNGNAASGFVESLTSNISTNSIGNLILGDVGSATQTISVSATNTSIVGDIGTLTASQSSTVALTGNTITGSVDSLTNNTVMGGIGNSVVGNVGALEYQLSASVTGNSTSGAIGDASPVVAANIVGNSISGTFGTVTANESETAALTGVAATGSIGYLTSVVSSDAAGNTLTGDVGDVGATQAVSVAVTGNEATGDIGTVTQTISVSAVGNEATGDIGTVTQTISVSAVGNEATGTVGNTRTFGSILGNSLTGNVGSLGVNVYNTIVGNQTTGTVGSVQASEYIVVVGITGVGAVGTIGGVRTADSIVGNGAIGSIGVLGVNVANNVAGNAAIGVVGIATPPEVRIALTGVATQALVGNASAGITRVATGNAVTVAAGKTPATYVAAGYVRSGYVEYNPTLNISVGLTGVSAAGSVGQMLIPSVNVLVLKRGTNMIVQNSTPKIAVFMRSSADHITPITGGTLTISISKNGAAFASAVRTITETGYGWYSIQLTAADTNVVGDIIIQASCSGADPTDIMGQVTATGGGLTPTQATMIAEMYQLYGLDPANPLVVTDTHRTAGASITQTIANTTTSTTMTRV